MEEKKVHTQGKPWTKVGTYNTYKEAQDRMSHMIASEPTYNFKIKRSGTGGSQFTLKKRLDPKLHEAEIKITQKMDELKSKSKKSKNKSKKRQ